MNVSREISPTATPDANILTSSIAPETLPHLYPGVNPTEGILRWLMTVVPSTIFGRLVKSRIWSCLPDFSQDATGHDLHFQTAAYPSATIWQYTVQLVFWHHLARKRVSAGLDAVRLGLADTANSPSTEGTTLWLRASRHMLPCEFSGSPRTWIRRLVFQLKTTLPLLVTAMQSLRFAVNMHTSGDKREGIRHHGNTAGEQSQGNSAGGVDPQPGNSKRTARKSSGKDLKRKRQDEDPDDEVSSQDPTPEQEEDEDENFRVGCPCAKNNPDRYEKVYGRGCTNPPGLEPRLVKTHLERVHSCLRKDETECRFCGEGWNTSHRAGKARIDEVWGHLVQCKSNKHEQLAQPEYLTHRQEGVVKAFKVGRYRKQPRKYWLFQFAALYPNTAIPNPEWDYFICRHHTTPVPMPAPSNAGPLSGVHSSPNMQTVVALANIGQPEKILSGLVGHAGNPAAAPTELANDASSSTSHPPSQPHNQGWQQPPAGHIQPSHDSQTHSDCDMSWLDSASNVVSDDVDPVTWLGLSELSSPHDPPGASFY